MPELKVHLHYSCLDDSFVFDPSMKPAHAPRSLKFSCCWSYSQSWPHASTSLALPFLVLTPLSLLYCWVTVDFTQVCFMFFSCKGNNSIKGSDFRFSDHSQFYICKYRELESDFCLEIKIILF